jgi:hypothetical protein
MEQGRRWMKWNAGALILAGAALTLLLLLYAADRRLGLYRHASERYRFHAIPVAISTLYHHRPHDYTAYRGLALRFQNTRKDLDDQIREALHPTYDIDGGTYYWVADDRGLADFVIGAFRLFGPRTRSLSKFYFVVTLVSLSLYLIGYWRSPATLTLPVFVLLCWLALATVMLVRVPLPFHDGWWGADIALYESRCFDVLALFSFLHLSILAGSRVPTTAATYVTAIPQALLLVWLYHARSSLGWQYLALGAIVALRVLWWVFQRLRSAEAPCLFRPLFAATLAALSIVGLKHYQQQVYHPHYAEEYGQRTFWHNALMGLTYHPALRETLPMSCCSDQEAVELVLARMERDDPGLDRTRWNKRGALDSLGNHGRFDWNGYEKVAREIYFDLWKDQPAAMAWCYAYYKPADIVRQVWLLADHLVMEAISGKAFEFLSGVAAALLALLGVRKDIRGRAGGETEFRGELASLAGLIVLLMPFSLIPGIAFYPTFTTVACFFLLMASLAGVAALWLATRTRPTETLTTSLPGSSSQPRAA